MKHLILPLIMLVSWAYLIGFNRGAHEMGCVAAWQMRARGSVHPDFPEKMCKPWKLFGENE